MDVRRVKFHQTAIRIIESIYLGDRSFTEEFCDPETELWLPHAGSGGTWKEIKSYFGCMAKGSHRIFHKSCAVLEVTKDGLVLAGNYEVEWKESQVWKESLHYTMVIRLLPDGKQKLRYLHISSDYEQEKKYRIHDTNERVFSVLESELLYLEAVHNHILWHCEHFTVETTDSLKKAESALSDNFYRVHRSFIVNVRRVRKMERCYIELDNSETISVPVKKYCDVREHILNIETRRE